MKYYKKNGNNIIKNEKENRILKDYLGIEKIKALEVYDSRGNPTVQVEVVTQGGFSGIALVPSGASTGSFEAVELRDEDDRLNGKGVQKAVKNVNTKIAKALQGMNVYNQSEIDNKLIDLDGTENKKYFRGKCYIGCINCSSKGSSKLIRNVLV